MVICWERAVPFAFHVYCLYFSAVLVVRVPFSFGIWGIVWNSIASVPDHCFFIFFVKKDLKIVKAHDTMTVGNSVTTMNILYEMIVRINENMSDATLYLQDEQIKSIDKFLWPYYLK